MITIRPFQPTNEEYATLVAIHNAIWPEEPTTVGYIKFRTQCTRSTYGSVFNQCQPN